MNTIFTLFMICVPYSYNELKLSTEHNFDISITEKFFIFMESIIY